MSGGPGYHGWTHRPASQGGTDPVPFALGGHAALMYKISAVTVDDSFTYDYNEETFVPWATISIPSGSANYFESVADVGDGNSGIRIKKPGWYRCWLTCDINVGLGFGSTNPDKYIPPYVHIWPAWDPGDLNGELSTFNPAGVQGTLQHRHNGDFSTNITPDGEPDDPSWPNNPAIKLGAQFDLLQQQSGYWPSTYSAQIRSSRATYPWQWSSVYMYLLRMGDIET